MLCDPEDGGSPKGLRTSELEYYIRGLIVVSSKLCDYIDPPLAH